MPENLPLDGGFSRFLASVPPIRRMSIAFAACQKMPQDVTSPDWII
jgi:hypothetical protein